MQGSACAMMSGLKHTPMSGQLSWPFQCLSVIEQQVDSMHDNCNIDPTRPPSWPESQAKSAQVNWSYYLRRRKQQRSMLSASQISRGFTESRECMLVSSASFQICILLLEHHENLDPQCHYLIHPQHNVVNVNRQGSIWLSKSPSG